MIRVEEKEGRLHLYTPYDRNFIAKIKKIGDAKWNGTEKAWTVDSVFLPAVKETLRDVYGYDYDSKESKNIDLQITFLEEIEEGNCDGIVMFGKRIAYALGRDSGAITGENVAFVNGGAATGGSRRHYTTIIEKDSTVILKGVPESIYEKEKTKYDSNKFKIEVIKRESKKALASKEDLLKEKEILLKRLKEINELLTSIE